MKSIANAFDSDPAKGTQNKVGTYLALVNYHANPITSAMFLTATAPNPLVVNYVAKATGQRCTCPGPPGRCACCCPAWCAC
jgi:DASS family divalent anion:Na+ symporter